MKFNHNPQRSPDLPDLAAQINAVLSRVLDKEWNYSRITLELRSLARIDSPYVLWVERIESGQKSGRTELAQLKSEINWGDRHSDELGFLEIVSLRLNKALLENASDELWKNWCPVIRTVKKQELELQGITEAFWYNIQEVGGEEFESR